MFSILLPPSMAFLRWMEEVMQNVVSIGIGVIPKMDLVTTTKKKKLSKPYELHWLMANNAVIISQEHHTSFLHGMHVSYNPLGRAWPYYHGRC